MWKRLVELFLFFVNYPLELRSLLIDLGISFYHWAQSYVKRKFSSTRHLSIWHESLSRIENFVNNENASQVCHLYVHLPKAKRGLVRLENCSLNLFQHSVLKAQLVFGIIWSNCLWCAIIMHAKAEDWMLLNLDPEMCWSHESEFVESFQTTGFFVKICFLIPVKRYVESFTKMAYLCHTLHEIKRSVHCVLCSILNITTDMGMSHWVLFISLMFYASQNHIHVLGNQCIYHLLL